MDNRLQVPVLFVVFNRPNNTRDVFAQIRKAKPSRLYVTADGPRTQIEREKVEAVRELILSGVDWECEIKTNFSDRNLGCRAAVSQGITWFFQNEEMGIILEDDCLPEISFFYYCQELLHRYKNVPEIGMISSGLINTQEKFSYSFVNYPLIWGWASWKRVWKNYDVNASFIQSAEEVKHLSGLQHSSKGVKRFWSSIYKAISTINTWDYQFTLLFLKSGLKTVYPNYTLVRNTGLGADSTHQFDKSFALATTSQPIAFPLVHPERIAVNHRVQTLIERAIFYEKPLWLRAFHNLMRKLNLQNLIKQA